MAVIKQVACHAQLSGSTERSREYRAVLRPEGMPELVHIIPTLTLRFTRAGDVVIEEGGRTSDRRASTNLHFFCEAGLKSGLKSGFW